jgi:hypothetical protein
MTAHNSTYIKKRAEWTRGDRFAELSWDASFVLFLLVDAETGRWHLVEDYESAKTLDGRLELAGVLGLVNGLPRTELAEAGAMLVEAGVMPTIADEFAARWLRSCTHPKWTAPVARGVN